jgi:preprotein translocase subunit YajC
LPAFFLTLPLIAIGWILIVRPQQQRMREQQAMVAALQVGDRVITAGGIHGTLLVVEDDTVEIEVAPGVVLTLARAAIAKKIGDEQQDADETMIDLTDEGDDSVEPGAGPAGEDPR